MNPIHKTDHSVEENSEDTNTSERTDASSIEKNSAELKLKVFLVEDSTEVRDRLKEMLKENKSIDLIGESGNAEQALTALQHLKPDVVILDIHMPKGEGKLVLQDIKANDSRTIVIIFTAFAYPQYRQAYLNSGADYFFDKTKDVQEMGDVLAELARKHFISRNHNEKQHKYR
jgi:DNA-binding NarL/FixJ family response regulator